MREKPFVSKLHVLIYILNATKPVATFDVMEDVTNLSKSAVVNIINSLIDAGLVNSKQQGRVHYYAPTKQAKELFNMP